MTIAGLSLKRGYYYWQPPQINGVRPKRRSLDTQDYLEALIKIEKLKVSCDFEKPVMNPSMKNAIVDYINEKELLGTHSPRTTHETDGVLHQIDSQLKHPQLNKITHQTIIQWRAPLHLLLGLCFIGCNFA